jgi:hypothetical protein
VKGCSGEYLDLRGRKELKAGGNCIMRSLHCYSFIHQCLYSPLLGPDRFFSFVILYTAGRILWTDQPIKRPISAHRTEQTQRHPYLEWDSSPRSQRSSGRRRFMPQTTKYYSLIRFEVLTPVVMKGSIFWDITPCTPFKVNPLFGVTSPFLGSKNKPSKKPA